MVSTPLVACCAVLSSGAALPDESGGRAEVELVEGTSDAGSR